MSGYSVGVLGATGAVGGTILAVLAERGFPAEEVVPFASERSAGKRIAWNGSELECRLLGEETIQGLDVVLSSAGGSVSSEWAPRFVEAGAVVVDNTSYWRMHDDVPLVVAGVNPDAAAAHKGIVANPNCTAMVALMALAPIHRAAGLERLVVSSYQAVSGTGQRAIEELLAQSRAILAGEDAPPPQVYPHQVAFNVLPQVEVFKDGDDYTTEERKVMGETRKILEIGEEVGISVTCARVPVVSGHSESINVRDPGGPLAGRLPGAAGAGPRGRRRRRPGAGELPDGDRRRRAATRSSSGGSAATPARSAPQPLGRRRQPAQGGGDQRGPGRRAARRARPAQRTGIAHGHRLRRGRAAVRRAARGRRRALGGDAGHGALRLGPLGGARDPARGGRRRRRRPDRPVDRRADRAGADPHPLLRRDVRRARAAAPPLEPGRPLAGDRDADHDGAAGARREGALPGARAGRRRSCSGRCSRRPIRSSPRRWSPRGWCRAPCATRSTSSRASTTASRCRSSSSSSSSPRPAATPGPKRRSWRARRSSARRSASPSGVLGGRLHHRLPGGGLTARYEGIYAVGFALFAFGLAEVTIGNGLIAAFVCGIAMGATERDVPAGLRRVRRERQRHPPGDHLLRLRRPDRRHRLRPQRPAAGRLRRLRAARRPPGRGDALLRPHRPAAAAEAVHGLVRAQGRRLDALRPLRPQVATSANAG